MKYEGMEITIGLYRRGHSQCEYTVRLDLGQWPSDKDLITVCDGTIPPEERHFGGRVEHLPNDLKHVVVYTN